MNRAKTFWMAASALAVFWLVAWPAKCEWPPFTDGSITVVVTDEQGLPVPGADVYCVYLGSSMPRATPLADSEHSRSDAEGRCTFAGLKPYDFLLRAKSGGLGAWGQAFLSTQDKNPEVALTLRLGRTLRGAVRNERGAPVPGVTVLMSQVMSVAVTDAEGRFALENVTDAIPWDLSLFKEGCGWMPLSISRGSTEAEVVMPKGAVIRGTVRFGNGVPAPGARILYHGNLSGLADDEGQFQTIPLSSRRTLNLRTTYREGDKRYRAEQRVPLEPGQDQVLTLHLKPYLKTSVSGKVLMVRTGAPVQAAILHANSPRFGCLGTRTHTGPDGDFVVTDLPAQRHYFSARPDDPVLYYAGGLLEVDLADGKPVENLVMEVAEGCAIRGTVLRADGEPAQEWGIRFRAGRRNYEWVQTNQEGGFVIGHLEEPEAIYELMVPLDYGKEMAVKVGPIGRGKVAEHVVIHIPLAQDAQTATIRGLVVDAAGRPVSGAAIWLRPARGSSSDQTDDAGRFTLEFYEGGEAELTVSFRMQLGGVGFQRRCTAREGGKLFLEAGQALEDLRVVVEVEPIVEGKVTDEQGGLLGAEVDLLAEALGYERLYQDRKGRFVATRLPDEPFLLEFTKRGYQARVIESGRDFQPGHRDIHVVMKRGPFKMGESVFSAVTGRKAVQEEVAAMFMGEEIRRRELSYRRMAAEEAKGPVPRLAPPPKQDQFRIHVADPEGKPINRIYLQAGVYFSGPRPTPVLKIPNVSFPKQAYHSEKGVFTISHPRHLRQLLWAEGTAREWLDPPEEPTAKPVLITLYPASKVAIRVVDGDGNPVAGLAVGHAAEKYLYRGSYHRLPRTDTDGLVELDRVSPGLRVYRVLRRVPEPEDDPRKSVELSRLIGIQVEPGKTYERTITFGKLAKGSPEGALYAWRRAYETRYRDKELPLKPSPVIREKIAAWAAEDLDILPCEYQWEREEMQLLGWLAKALELKSAVPAIERTLLRWHKWASAMLILPGPTGELTSALAALAGDDAVGFLAEAAANPDLPYATRRDALIGLGEVGSEKSVAAFAKLRDAAFDKPGAPQRKQSYTHEERMAEAVTMVLVVIPDYVPPAIEEDPMRRKSPKPAWVSEDYSTGTICFGDQLSIVQVKMRRFRDEWLVIRTGGVGVM